MKSFPKSPPGTCSGRALRLWSAAALTTCGVLLAPASALADHMPGMPNGVACPHAAGEGPDALAAPGPGESPTSQRASSETPLGTVETSAPEPDPAPAPASKPATKPAAQVTQPATQQVAQPTAQAQAQTRQPAASSESAPVAAVARQPVVTRTAERPAARRAERPARSVERRVFERRFNGLEPRPAKLTTPREKPVTAIAKPQRGAALPAERRPAAAPATRAGTPVIVAFALLIVLGLAGAFVVGRRRGGAGAAVGAAPEPPAAPARADAALEAELYELIAEARARALLDVEHEDAREPAAPR